MSDLAWIGWQRKSATIIKTGVVVDIGRHLFKIVLARPWISLCLLSLGLGWTVIIAVQEPTLTWNPSLVRPVVVAPVAVGNPSQTAWLDIIKPLSIFSLEAPEFAGLPALTRARRHPSGGGRQDVVSLGTLGGDDPALRLTLYRRGAEPYAKNPSFADIAHQAAEAGFSIARSGLADLVSTRFGRFEILDVALAPVTENLAAQNHGFGPTRAELRAPLPCTGLRLVLDAPALTIIGLVCGAHRRGIPHERLGCLLDRLDLASGGDDRLLVDYFAASELKRNMACSGTRLGPDLLHATWLDDAPATPIDHPATPRKNVHRR